MHALTLTLTWGEYLLDLKLFQNIFWMNFTFCNDFQHAKFIFFLSL